ncbi:MAG TPA: YjbQ family protein [Dehalococcoidia bacterium]|nr:YjbQ family protein [Dehalococcoidia bacterium]
MWTHSFEVTTGRTPAVVDLTSRINAALSGRGDGLVHVFLPHATAGLAVMEVASGSEPDLLDRLIDLLPPTVPYHHRHGTPGHGRDHVLPAIIPPALVLAVRAGRLDLGTWQSVVLVDTNVDNPVRTVKLSFLAG